MPLISRRTRFSCPAGSRAGLLASVVVLWLAGLPARAADPDNCLFCHQYRGLGRYDPDSDELHVFYIDPAYVHDQLGPHAQIACTDCHIREEVAVVPHLPVSRVDCTRQCHLVDPGGLETRFSHAPVAETLALSVHAEDRLRDLNLADGPLLGANQSACLYCHDEPVFRDPTGAIPVLAALGSRTFDRCDTCHTQQSATEIAYYLRHIAARLQPARPTLEMAQLCAVCHSDPDVVAEFEMHDAVASFVRSYHGKAALLGDQSTANCISCHVAPGASAHLMLGPEDPGSSVSPARLPSTCRSTACHPGADVQIAAAGVHLDLPDARGTLEYWLAAAFILFTVLTFGPSLVMTILELLAIVIGAQRHDHALEELTHAVLGHPEGRKRLVRFTVSQRVQHWVLVILFALLALTGFPLKFADRAWSRSVIDALGGLDVARTIHHWAGLALMAGLVAHLVYVAGTWYVRWRVEAAQGTRRGFVGSILALPMWVGPNDALDMGRLLAYLMRLRRTKPSFGRFGVREKFEYIGVFWGTVLLGLTGLLLWGEQISSRFLSGRALNLALIAHTYEAFLALIHVGILHIVHVMLAPSVFPLSPATITGQTPAAELAEFHDEQVRAVARELDISAEEGTGHA